MSSVAIWGRDCNGWVAGVGLGTGLLPVDVLNVPGVGVAGGVEVGIGGVVPGEETPSGGGVAAGGGPMVGAGSVGYEKRAFPVSASTTITILLYTVLHPGAGQYVAMFATTIQALMFW